MDFPANISERRGWDAYRSGAYKPDYKIFWSEQWAQRMLDIDTNIHPYINMVEGIVGVDGKNKLHLNNFITISRNMVTCDSLACWLMGHDPREMPYLRIANERGLGENNIEKIPLFAINGNNVERISDYRTLERGKMGVNVYGLGGRELRYF